jgi:hypothetical protein
MTTMMQAWRLGAYGNPADAIANHLVLCTGNHRC